MVENREHKEAYCEIKVFCCLELSYYVYDHILFVTKKTNNAALVSLIYVRDFPKSEFRESDKSYLRK